jgi:predicted RNA-binding Zn-ribbon protein involved in translation (DUF1610 family)
MPSSFEDIRRRKRPLSSKVAIAALVSLIALVLVLFANLPVRAQPDAPEPRKEYPADYHPALKGESKEVAGLAIYGPDAPECVKFEPDGLRINLPTGYPRPHPGTGVITDFGVKGDFEITVEFEVLQEPKAGMAHVKLVIVPGERAEPEVWHKANQRRAVFGRERWAGNKFAQFFADATTWTGDIPKNKWGNEDFSKVELHTHKRSPTMANSCQLRLVRSADILFFSTSEDAGKEFMPLYKHEFGAKDLKNVRVLAATNGPDASVEVRITDLQIRADAFVKPIAALPPSAPPAPSRGLWLIVLAITVPLVLIAFVVGIWLVRRTGGRTAPAPRSQAPLGNEAASPSPVIAFECPGCGKRLKAKTERAGSKVKCPQCGKAVAVPNAEELS